MTISSLLVHVTGVLAISQLILNANYHVVRDFYRNLNDNSTGVLHRTFNGFAEAFSFLVHAGGEDLVRLLQAVMYLAVALYVLYLMRLVQLHGVFLEKNEAIWPNHNHRVWVVTHTLL